MYKVRAVFSERITDDISEAKIIAFEVTVKEYDY